MQAARFDGSFDGWVATARRILYSDTPPAEVDWADAREQASQGDSLWGDGEMVAESASSYGAERSQVKDSDHVSNVLNESPRFHVPKRFLELARIAACYRDARRWTLLYRVLWRLTHGEPHLLDVSVDEDTHALLMIEKAIRRDVHKMRAFVRFREISTAEGPWFVAWFEPEHHIVEANSGFFRDRFASMRWSILTPDRCVHWDLRELTFSEGVDRSKAPREDAVEDLWRAYYGSVFNPARLKVKTMTSHMAQRFWKNLPEAQDIPTLIAAADNRVQIMRAESDVRAAPAVVVPLEVPATEDLGVLAKAVQGCRGCPLWKDATCAVFGEGPKNPSILVVGEQPGDQEDRAGKPFVGPAGQLLNRAFAAAGIAREELYVTNAVKHFKWTPRGKRRLHAKPSAREVAACRPWVTAEIRAVKPRLIVCLGSTAANSIVGGDIKVTQVRGEFLPTEFGMPALITLHPSALLRLADGIDPQVEFDRFVEDLRKIKSVA